MFYDRLLAAALFFHFVFLKLLINKIKLISVSKAAIKKEMPGK
jgi:hypothetical protein